MTEKEQPFEVRLAARLEALNKDTSEVANALKKEGYPEGAVAAVLSMHELLNELVHGRRKVRDIEKDAKFIRALHDGVRGIYDGLLMGGVPERMLQHEKIAEKGSLRRTFRNALENELGEKIGPTETSFMSEVVV